VVRAVRDGFAAAGSKYLAEQRRLLAFVHDLTATVRDFRNRIFHHEPAWKRFGVITEADAIQHLRDKIATIEELLALIHPDNIGLLETNGLLSTAQRACTSDEIRRFQHLAQTHTVRSLVDLAQLVQRSAANNAVLQARLEGEPRRRFVVSPH